MAFLSSLSSEDLSCYARTVIQSVKVRSHFDVLIWLRGEMQRYLPHDILLAAWGDFSSGALSLDILSELAGVRSKDSSLDTIRPLLMQLFAHWADGGLVPFAVNTRSNCFLLDDARLHSEFGDALQDMGCAMVHGCADQRDSTHCLYVVLSTKDSYSAVELSAMSSVLPYVDAALRQVKNLPHQNHHQPTPTHTSTHTPPGHDLSDRELEILHWVSVGKTNPEIGSILDISEFTVKNHLQRIFKKLNVSSRAQAVSIFAQSMVNA